MTLTAVAIAHSNPLCGQQMTVNCEYHHHPFAIFVRTDDEY